ncbi:hypothetical protein KZZ20_00925 [Methylacidiphilum fumariolicum]|uniref:hypothetical protein n=1 Tax=Candidatus Methylacidiphilum fumarolicum TaxID=591154 RepID=UPI00031D57AC|nr:hypothetical protein [Candidatus Methylacidiphilum fumarolicum]MBW6414092.1 hypothetical protein [Candidatus Methylacidiphilum fumarolicum]
MQYEKPAQAHVQLPLYFHLRLAHQLSALFVVQVIPADPLGLGQVLGVPPDSIKAAPLLPLLLVDARQPDEQLAEAFPILLPMIVGKDFGKTGVAAASIAYRFGIFTAYE